MLLTLNSKVINYILPRGRRDRLARSPKSLLMSMAECFPALCQGLYGSPYPPWYTTPLIPVIYTFIFQLSLEEPRGVSLRALGHFLGRTHGQHLSLIHI